MNNVDLREGERTDDLQRGGLRIIQNTGAFRFGTDAVLLADFAAVRPHDRLCDLGSGTGVLPLLLSARAEGISCDAVEIQTDMADMAARSMALNGLSDRIRVHCRDLREVREFLPHAAYDLVVSNPPYGRADASAQSPSEKLRIARSETACTVRDITEAAAWLLRFGGRFCAVFPSFRMLEMIDAMRERRIEPKRLRMVSSFSDQAPRLCLIQGALGARPALHLLPPLILYKEKGVYSAEARAIYGLSKEG